MSAGPFGILASRLRESVVWQVLRFFQPVRAQLADSDGDSQERDTCCRYEDNQDLADFGRHY